MINIAELIENRKIKIGFIGLGAMGSRMANNLINKSFNLLVFDLDSNKMDVLIDKGATGFNSIKEIAENSDLIITSLPSSKEIEAVVLADDGLLNFMKSGSVFVDVSTALPSSTTKLSQMFADKNIEMLDAPVSGGTQGAENATLAIMVGGSKDVFEVILPVFEVLGKNVFYIGKAGSGNNIKILNNMLFSMILASTCETLILGSKLGLSPKEIVNVVGTGSGRSFVLNEKVPKFIYKQNFDPGMQTKLLDKDIELARTVATEMDMAVPCLNTAHTFYKMAKNHGLENKDCSSIIKVMEEIYQERLPIEE